MKVILVAAGLAFIMLAGMGLSIVQTVILIIVLGLLALGAYEHGYQEHVAEARAKLDGLFEPGKNPLDLE